MMNEDYHSAGLYSQVAHSPSNLHTTLFLSQNSDVGMERVVGYVSAAVAGHTQFYRPL